MARKSVFSFSLIGLCLFIQGCDLPEPLTGLIAKIQPLSQTPKPSASAVPTTSPDHRQVNAEFIKELFKVTLKRDVRSEEEFLRYINILDQGGHYEGIYNGIVYSTEYRDKEKGSAPVAALKLYAELMAQIVFDQRHDPLIEKKQESPAPTLTSSLDAEKKALVEEFEKDGITKPLFTLKRRLGEETLKTIDLKKEYKEKFATWYGKFTVFLNNKGADFGLPERNKTDEYFHYKWALEADEDRLKWECLNRLHVLMNAQAEG